MALLGAHLSAAGGVANAARAAQELKCESLQVFLRSPGAWKRPERGLEDVSEFLTVVKACNLTGRCFAHAPYLLNLSSGDRHLWKKSIEVLGEELQTAAELGLAGVVLHPGSAGGDPREEGIARAREALAETLQQAPSGRVKVLLETTAGSGSQLGVSLGELALIVPVRWRERVGICIDTAHLWGAGYDLSGNGWERVVAELGEHWETVSPDLIHGNDTLMELGSRKDRHVHPGEGLLGESFFRRLLGDESLSVTPLVLEIPPGRKNENIHLVLSRLRSWM